MTYPTEPPREHESAYFVQDRENIEEMKRLQIQDTMLTTGMGGVLPEQADPPALRCVLDVGCGTGGWLMQMAQTYPNIEKLVGADVSGTMIEHARTQAEAQHLSHRVRFQTMDALRALDFPNASFDLVNQRLGFSWLRTWEWKKILSEYQRVTRPGGIIRITESAVAESNSQALTMLCDLALHACYHAGYFFERKSDGIIFKLVPLMTQYGIEEVKHRDHTLVFPAGTSEHESFYEDMRAFYRVAFPFFQKWIRTPANYEEIYQQALKEMRAAGFVATGQLRTAWGKRSTNADALLIRGLQ